MTEGTYFQKNFVVMLLYFIVIFVGVTCTGSEIDEQDYRHLMPAEKLVVSGQNFTFTCRYPLNDSVENITWKFLNVSLGLDQTTVRQREIDGKIFKAGTITCYIVVDEHHILRDIHCLTANGTWSKTKWKTTPLPAPNKILLETSCFSTTPMAFSLLHVGIVPEQPQNLSCITVDYIDLHCRWMPPSKITMHEKLKYEYRHTNYTMKYGLYYYGVSSSVCSACNQTNNTWCVTENYCETDVDYPFFNLNLSISVEAKNMVGTASTTILCHPGVLPSAPQILSTNSHASAQENKVDVNVSVTSRSEIINHLPAKWIYFKIFQAGESVEDFDKVVEQRKNSEEAFSMECWHKFCQQNEQSTSEKVDKFTKTWKVLAIDSEKEIHVPDVMANVALVVAGKFKMLNDENICADHLWSAFTYSNVIKTKTIKPGKLETALFWYQDYTETYQSGTNKRVILLWKEDGNLRYTFNLINSFHLSAKGDRMKELSFDDFTVDLKAQNEVGFSEVSSVSLAADADMPWRYENLHITPTSNTTAVVEFKLICKVCEKDSGLTCACNNAKAEDAPAGFSFIVFFWPVGNNTLQTTISLNKLNRQRNLILNLESNAMKLKHGGFVLSKLQHSLQENEHDSSYITSNVNAQSLEFVSLPFSRVNEDNYRGILTHNFLPYAVYQFAISPRKGVRQWPSLRSRHGYIFRSKAPSGLPNNITVTATSENSFQVKWYSTDVQEQHGDILRYRVYIFTSRNCRKLFQASPSSETCADACPKPDRRLVVEGVKTSEEPWTILDIEEPEAYFADVENAVSGMEYYIRISALNSYGEGPCSQTVWKFSGVETRLLKILTVAAIVILSIVLVGLFYRKRRKFWNNILSRVPKPFIPDEIMQNNQPIVFTSGVSKPNHEPCEPWTNEQVNDEACSTVMIDQTLDQGPTIVDEASRLIMETSDEIATIVETTTLSAESGNQTATSRNLVSEISINRNHQPVDNEYLRDADMAMCSKWLNDVGSKNNHEVCYDSEPSDAGYMPPTTALLNIMNHLEVTTNDLLGSYTAEIHDMKKDVI